MVSLEANIKSYEKSLAKAMAQTNTTARGIEKRFSDMNKGVGASLGTVGKIAGGVISAGAAKEFLDSATKIDNALKVAGLSGNELNAVYEKLYQSAQKNGAPLVALADLYGKVSLSQKELGVGSLELAKFSDNVALALRVSGKTAAESSGALMQLSQALGAGTVRAEEFNSILEGAPAIAQAAANGIEEAGGSVSKLRKLVNDGEISSKAFFLGFQAGADGLRSKAAAMDMTISQAFTNLKNAAINAAREVDQVSKISGDAVNGVNNLARIAIRQAITGPIAGALGSAFSSGGGALPMPGSANFIGPTFSDGGYTGRGGKHEPAGLVHKGEYVFDQDAVKRIGVGNLRRLQGYANGGYVGMPNLPRSTPSVSKGAGVTVNLIEDASRAGQTQKSDNGSGGFDLTVYVDSITAKNAANPGSATSQVLAQRGRLASR